MLNRAELIGRLTRDPELRYTPGGTPVCRIGLATNEHFTGIDGQAQERTEYHDVIAWRALAETSAKHLAKGRLVHIDGRLHTETWEDDAGGRHRRTEVVARSIRFLDRPEVAPALTEADEAEPAAV